MDESDNYDENLKDIRLKIAMEKNDWYSYFKERNKYINRMILSFFGLWTFLGIILILYKYDFIYFVFVPNLLWLIVFLPFFIYKLYTLTNIIKKKQEEIILLSWNKTHNINAIMLLTGLEENYIRYYLTKNGLK